jgi:hypothetical protein
MADNPLSVTLPPSPLMETGLSNNNMHNISRTKSKIKNRQGIIDFMFDDDSTYHEGGTGLSIICTHSTSTSSPSTLIPASITHPHVEDYLMTVYRTKIRGELTDSMLDKSASDCNNDIVLLDNYLNPIPPSPMTAICTSKNKTKDVQSSEHRKRNKPKLNDFMLHNQSSQLPVPGSATLHVILSLPMVPGIHQPIMT